MKLEYEKEYILDEKVLSSLREGDVVVIDGGEEGVVFEIILTSTFNELRIKRRHGGYYSDHYNASIYVGHRIILKANHKPIWKGPNGRWDFQAKGTPDLN